METVVAQAQTEFFGYFIYGPDLTYEELLDREDALKTSLQEILAGIEADYIHFEANGDTLRVQCGLGAKGEDLFHAVCIKIAPFMQNGLDGRLLFVDKDLHMLHAYSLHKGKWQEAAIALPPPGYLEEHQPVTPKPSAPATSRGVK